MQLSLNFEKQRGPKRLAFVVRCVVSLFFFNIKFKWQSGHHDIRLKPSRISFCKNLFKRFNESQYKMEKKRTQC